MNHIEQAYQQGEKIRQKDWNKKEFIKKYKYDDLLTIDENSVLMSPNKFNFKTHPDYWEIWHEDLPLLKDQPDIKAQIQTHLNQIQELLKQL